MATNTPELLPAENLIFAICLMAHPWLCSPSLIRKLEVLLVSPAFHCLIKKLTASKFQVGHFFLSNKICYARLRCRSQNHEWAKPHMELTSMSGVRRRWRWDWPCFPCTSHVCFFSSLIPFRMWAPDSLYHCSNLPFPIVFYTSSFLCNNKLTIFHPHTSFLNTQRSFHSFCFL